MSAILTVKLVSTAVTLSLVIYGTVHIALGSNDTFGGTVAAGIHVDGIITRPELSLDGRVLVRDGKVLV